MPPAKASFRAARSASTCAGAKEYISKLKGKIVDGVLDHRPGRSRDVAVGVSRSAPGDYHVFRGFEFKLKLDPEARRRFDGRLRRCKALQSSLKTSWSTHHHSYGQLSSPSQYKAMMRLAGRLSRSEDRQEHGDFLGNESEIHAGVRATAGTEGTGVEAVTCRRGAQEFSACAPVLCQSCGAAPSRR